MTRALASLTIASLALGGCITTRGDAPIWSGAAKTNLDQTAACIMQGINAALAAENPSLTVAMQITDPGKAAEIGLQQSVNGANEMFFVRLTAAGPQTLVTLNALPAWQRTALPAVERCASKA